MRVVLCGVGALGSNAAVACRTLPVTLRLVDFDRVEGKNLLSQAFVRPSLGKNKAEALRLQLLNFWGVKAEAMPVRVTADNVAVVCADAGLVVDAFDNQASRLVLSAHARKTDTPLVHAAMAQDGRFGLVRWDDRFTPDAEDQAGQATCEAGEHLPFIALLAAALAGTIAAFVRHGARRDAHVTTGGVQSIP